MAQVVGGNQVKLSNGQVVNAQQGAWYDGQQFWGGTLSNPGQINSLSNQQGAGQQVSREVVAQTNPNNVAYLEQQRQQQGLQSSSSGNGSSTPLATNGGGVSTSVPNLEAKYNELTNTPEIQALKKDLADKIAARDKAISEVQNNPWYSQATRGGKIAGITSDAGREIDQLTGQLNSKLQEVQTQLGLETQQYQLQHQAQQDALQANAVNTTMYDDGTNQYAVSIDRNGNVVNKQLIGQSKPSASAGKVTDAERKAYYEDALRSDAQSGVPLSQIFAIYSGLIDPNTIYTLYNSTSRYGADSNPDATPGTGYLSNYGVTLFK